MIRKMKRVIRSTGRRTASSLSRPGIRSKNHKEYITAPMAAKSINAAPTSLTPDTTAPSSYPAVISPAFNLF
ncbi:MAG: hypothetical protein NXY59_05590 [Aigarchaeota archaeon]|nr:hypothetical protein [Candidatus Pelearchaeum maunauluense]